MSRKAKAEKRPLDAAAFEALCKHIAAGKSLLSWSQENGHPYSTVASWILRDEDLNKRYRAARQMQADAHIDQLIELADSEVPTDFQGRVDSAAVNQLRLRVDTRKWIASKYHPSMYGDRMAVDANVNANLGELPPGEIMGRIVALLSKHGLKVVPADAGSSDGSDESR